MACILSNFYKITASYIYYYIIISNINIFLYFIKFKT